MSATPSAQYRLTIRVKLDDAQGILGRVTSAIGEAGGMVGAVDVVEIDGASSLRDIVVDASGRDHWEQILAAIDARRRRRGDRHHRPHLPAARRRQDRTAQQAPAEDARRPLDGLHARRRARVCLAIADDEDKAFQYTIKRNTVAVVSDGTAVLGLGDIGPQAAMPVMEGKCCLFKEFAGVDAFPICLDTTDTDEIVRDRQADGARRSAASTSRTSPRRAASRSRSGCSETLDIPVFHDDQHGTAVVVMAALLNAVKLTGRRPRGPERAVIGLGAAGIAVTKILLAAGVTQIVGADSSGALHVQREDYLDGSMNPVKRWFAEVTNPECRVGRARRT